MFYEENSKVHSAFTIIPGSNNTQFPNKSIQNVLKLHHKLVIQPRIGKKVNEFAEDATVVRKRLREGDEEDNGEEQNSHWSGRCLVSPPLAREAATGRSGSPVPGLRPADTKPWRRLRTVFFFFHWGGA